MNDFIKQHVDAYRNNQEAGVDMPPGWIERALEATWEKASEQKL